MRIIQKTPEKLVIRMDANHSLANAIRRSVEEISTLAVDEVEFFNNDSALYDEFLAHRLGLVPLRTDSKMGAKTSVNLKLKKSGPCSVYSGDFKGGANVVYDKIPLTILEKGQDLELVATARLGNGIEHTKHLPGLCYYRNILEVKSSPDNDKIIKNSKGVIKPEKKGNAWICDLKEAEVDEILKIDKESVKDTEELLFFVESFGQLDADAILKRAVDVLDENLKVFEKEIK